MGALRLEDVAYSYDDYKEWEGDWELIDGFPIALSPAPMIKHQSLESRFIRYIGNQLEDCLECEVLNEVEYKVSEDTVLRPDIVLTCGESSEAYLTIAPQIVVEIISKSTVKKDETYKFDIYERERVKYYILVYPDELVAKVYKNIEAKFRKEGDFTTQKYRFEDTTCKVEIDFEEVFRKYRK